MSPWWSHPTADSAPGNGEAGKGDAGKGDTGRGDAGKGDTGRGGGGKGASGERAAPKDDGGERAAPKGDGGRRTARESDSAKAGAARAGAAKTGAVKAGTGEAGAAKGGRAGDDSGRRRRAAEPEPDYTFDAGVPPVDIARFGRESIDSGPERTSSVSDERKIALFCDLENIALGVRDSDIKKFDIHLVLERLLEKGKIIVKKAYCDWERYADYKRAFHEAAIEMIDIPQRYYSGKNSADIKMVVDAMDLSYSKEHLDTFALLSGDSDFSPLVSKLKENNKYVIGIGVKNSSSNLLIDNCDEFVFYEDVWRDRQQAPKVPKVPAGNKKAAEAFALMVDAIQALLRENKDVLWGSMIKQTMQRKKPSFSESYYGYGSFSDLLEDAERQGLVKLKKDQRSGTYIVTGFAGPK
jgi:uncharacterized protein (TIGR00288 family)